MIPPTARMAVVYWLDPLGFLKCSEDLSLGSPLLAVKSIPT